MERWHLRHGLRCTWRLVVRDSGWFWRMKRRFDNLDWERTRSLSSRTNVGLSRGRRSKEKVRIFRIKLSCDNLTHCLFRSQGFPLVASLETIQVALTLALSSLHGDTSNVSRMASLVSMAVNSALDLEVNVDPYEQPGDLTPLEVEMRRRTFWALYVSALSPLYSRFGSD